MRIFYLSLNVLLLTLIPGAVASALPVQTLFPPVQTPQLTPGQCRLARTQCPTLQLIGHDLDDRVDPQLLELRKQYEQNLDRLKVYMNSIIDLLRTQPESLPHIALCAHMSDPLVDHSLFENTPAPASTTPTTKTTAPTTTEEEKKTGPTSAAATATTDTLGETSTTLKAVTSAAAASATATSEAVVVVTAFRPTSEPSRSPEPFTAAATPPHSAGAVQPSAAISQAPSADLSTTLRMRDTSSSTDLVWRSTAAEDVTTATQTKPLMQHSTNPNVSFAEIMTTTEPLAPSSAAAEGSITSLSPASAPNPTSTLKKLLISTYSSENSTTFEIKDETTTKAESERATMSTAAPETPEMSESTPARETPEMSESTQSALESHMLNSSPAPELSESTPVATISHSFTAATVSAGSFSENYTHVAENFYRDFLRVTRSPRDLLVIVDSSGTMSPDELKAIKNALKTMLGLFCSDFGNQPSDNHLSVIQFSGVATGIYLFQDHQSLAMLTRMLDFIYNMGGRRCLPKAMEQAVAHFSPAFGARDNVTHHTLLITKGRSNCAYADHDGHDVNGHDIIQAAKSLQQVSEVYVLGIGVSEDPAAQQELQSLVTQEDLRRVFALSSLVDLEAMMSLVDKLNSGVAHC